ncbi:XkdT-like protein [Clostridium tetani]|nr:XkdT-like protein [Clostridium tetani]
MVQLKDYVPFFIAKIREIQEIYKAQGKELDNINLDIKDLVKQCFVSTATWGLDYWEELLNINIDKSKSTQERRSNILAKLRGQGTTTIEVIRDIAKAYADKVEIREDNPNYAFYINLESYKGYPFNLDSLYSNIEEIKPAHLECKYKLKSTTKDKIKFASIIRIAETITIYPWTPKEIVVKGKVYIPISNNRSLETITIYPGKGGD